MKLKRFLPILALLMLVFVLVSCQGGGDVTTDGEQSETTPAETELVLFENGKFNFKVIRAEHAEKSIISAAGMLRADLEDITGAAVDMADDFVKKGEEHDAEAYEILFGMTNYPQSAKPHEGLAYGQYRITVDGHKIIIATYGGESASKAALAFASFVEEQMSEGRAVISAAYNTEVSTNSLLSSVPAYNAGSLSSTYTGTYGEKAYVYNSTTADDFSTYVDIAVNNGCKLHSTSEMGKNRGATLKKGNAVINVFFTQADKKTRIIVENINNTSLPTTEADNKYEKVCDSVLVQLGLEQPYDGGQVFTTAVANFNNGMGYIFRLHDGSFIIIDGGFNKTLGAKMIYNKLVELAPDKNNIVIAAWIMSHQHGDHVGAYRKFTEAYSKQVKLETVIYNMPNSTELGSVNESSTNAGMVSQYVSSYSGAVSSIAHPGQVHYIRNAKIEVLHSIDLLRPATSFSGGNSFCIAVKITLDGQTFLFAGDSHTDMTASLVKNYGDYLKSDFCQVVHHGAPGASNEFYKAVDPTVVIWPLGTWDYYPWRRYETFNTYLFESPNVKEIILAGHTDRTITLPYTFPTEKVLPEEIEVTWNYLDGKN